MRIKGQCTFNVSRLVRGVLRREVYAFLQKSQIFFLILIDIQVAQSFPRWRTPRIAQ